MLREAGEKSTVASMLPALRPPTARPAFTLIELLIAVGIIGVLASVVIVAVSPRKVILGARDAERALHANAIQSAMIQYQIEHGKFPNMDKMGRGAESALQVCTLGVTANPHCLPLDALVPTYLAQLPRDIAEPCPDYTGFLVYLDGGLLSVVQVHKGKLPGDAVTVTPGCSGTGSSASSSFAFSDAPPSSSSASSLSSSLTSFALSSVASASVSSSLASAALSSAQAGSSAGASTFSSSSSLASVATSTTSMGFGYGTQPL
jgi:prepilin-type N-terminal cleavage/methylation domain-containing protein